ncbi:Major Facilitator Superfamily protein [Pseudoalteromonas sp. P1-13-1a]|uniref:MFS transporter n=1 Tax=Pseudoalteromonas sp. P1-13-1a TaxID=1723756 RepID=UPI0006D67C94|nr:MFS transporter [Pseudoalteromonas sp. P1-13-1a]KPZ60299.1 Major Facilitator Superfamily protein [Pseudoalteromonas sp. P1-13-1a]
MKKLTKEQVYKRLNNDEDARACKDINDEDCKEVAGNFILLLASQLFSKFADALLNPKVTLPWLMQSLNVPSAFIAWLVPIRESGSLLPQLAIANIIRQRPVRKWVWVCGAFAQALCIGAMVGVSFVLEGAQAGYAILALLVLFSLARGFNSIAAKDVLGKVIPKKKRGNISGLAASIAGLATLTFGLMMWFFSGQKEQNTVLIALSLGAVLWVAAALFYSRINEYKGATQGGKNGFLIALSKLQLLYQDKQFAHFVITRAFLLCSALSAPFYIILASSQQFEFSLLAIFLAVSGLASLISGPIWGRLSDFSSQKVLVISALLVTINGVSVFVIASWYSQLFEYAWVIPSFYFLLCIAHQGVRLGRKTYLVDMAQGNKRTDYVSVSNTIIGILLLMLGSIGLLDAFLSTAQLILLYSLLGLLGAISAIFLPQAE